MSKVTIDNRKEDNVEFANKRKKLVNQISGFLKDDTIEPRVRILNLAMVTIISASLLGMIPMILYGINGVWLNLLIAFFSLLAEIYYIKFKKADLSAFILCTVCILGVLPFMYFEQGGMYSGMPIWFMFCSIIAYVLVSERIKIWMFSACLLMSIACIVAEIYHPEMVTPIEDEAGIYTDVLVSLIIVSICLLFVFWIHISTDKRQRIKLEKQTAELIEKQNELLEKQKELELAYKNDKQELVESLAIALKNAEAANDAKSAFLFNMSHDIRTPMNAILGYARLMETKNDDPEKVLDYLGKIESSGEYLLSIINNVLDMSRIESGKVELNLSQMDVGNDESYILGIFTDDFNKKNLEFTHSLKVSHRYVLADEVRMNQIMVNILSNAVKYTPSGGKIHLETTEVPCDKKGYATYIVEISDSGIGMSKEFQEHIFDSFTRERTSTESKVIGTGLGMSIVKKLVDLMEGEIEVESEVGKGSTFRVTLTLRIIENPDLDLENKNISSYDDVKLEGRRILLAEDNELNSEIAIALLDTIGVSVEWAEDGERCLEMLEKYEPGHFDMILMDVQMPKMNGYEATRRIRALENRKLAKIPIVAMTANVFEKDVKDALDAGMNGHLAKPIEVPALIEAIIENLEKRDGK